MKWSYRFNPDMPFGHEMIPSMENYENPPRKFEDYPRKRNSFQNFGFMELFSLVMVIPFSIFVYKFFYLLVLPLLPLSIITFELVLEIAPLNKLVMFGSSFLVAYLSYRGIKYLLRGFTFFKGVLLLLLIYLIFVGVLFGLVDYFPQNEALQGVMVAIDKLVMVVKSKI